MHRLRSSALVGFVATLSDLSVELLRLLRTTVRSQSSLVAENLVRRKQLAFHQNREVKPGRLTDAVRVALVFWSCCFDWKQALSIVQPDTLIRWHRRGFKLSLTAERSVFVNRLRLMSRYPHRLLVITAALSEAKSPQTCIAGSPNRITQSLIAVLAGLGMPFLCTETHELGEELVASYLYQVHLYHRLETNDYGRFLANNDL